jgi:hypothetical protein
MTAPPTSSRTSRGYANANQRADFEAQWQGLADRAQLWLRGQLLQLKHGVRCIICVARQPRLDNYPW